MKQNNHCAVSKKNRGFTLTEMVIVIAVIAVLAAVLIPTFIGIANKSKVSADIQTAKNATTLIAGATEMQDIYDNITEDKINLFDTKSKGRFAYEKNSGKIVLLDKKMKIVDNQEAEDQAVKDLWFFLQDSDGVVAKEDITDSTYRVHYFLANNYSGDFNLDTLSNFDTGRSVLTGNINFGSETSAITEANTLDNAMVVSGNIEGTVLLNAPNAEVIQKGSVKDMNVVAVKSSSLKIQGSVSTITVTTGKVEVTKEAFISKVVLPKAANNVKIENKGFINKVEVNEEIAVENKETVKLDVKNGTVGNFADPTLDDIRTLTSKNSNSVQIQNVEAMCNFRDQVNSGTTFKGMTVILMNNITLENGWLPIGAFNRSNYNASKDDANHSFSGVFDGNNKTISGLTNAGFDPTVRKEMQEHNSSTLGDGEKFEYSYGLFGIVTNATIKNLVIERPNINIPTGSMKFYGDSVAAVVGFGSGDITIDNVKVNGGNIEAYDCVAGIIGRIYQADQVTINNCQVSAAITGQAKIGGIAGYINNDNNDAAKNALVKVSNCRVTGNVTAKMTNPDSSKTVVAGGILASIQKAVMPVEVFNNTVKCTIKAEFAVAEQEASYLKADAILPHSPNGVSINAHDNTINGAVIIPKAEN